MACDQRYCEGQMELAISAVYSETTARQILSMIRLGTGPQYSLTKREGAIQLVGHIKSGKFVYDIDEYKSTWTCHYEDYRQVYRFTAVPVPGLNNPDLDDIVGSYLRPVCDKCHNVLLIAHYIAASGHPSAWKEDYGDLCSIYGITTSHKQCLWYRDVLIDGSGVVTVRRDI